MNMFKDYDRFFIGFDKVMSRFTETADQITKSIGEFKYPPYNIKKVDDNKYVIEMAVAGFAKRDLELEFDGDKLTIKGNTKSEPESEWPSFMYHGLAKRAFTRTFNVADHVELKNAKLVNGILKIVLESITPEPKTAQKIDIVEGDD